MKTRIETKDLTKIINPLTDGVYYKGQMLNISKQSLEDYVNNPTKHELFKPSDDILVDFYRNMALYIINANGDNKFITLDLNNANPFIAGQMEFITNIYTDTKYTFINLDETGENLNLIKAKELHDVSEEFKHIDRPINMATDAPINTPSVDFFKITKEEPTETEKKLSRELAINQILESVDAILSTSNFYREPAFDKYIKATNKELINSDEVKIKLLETFGPRIVQALFSWKLKDFSIDFSSPTIYQHIISQVKDRKFELISYLFESFEEMKFQRKHNPADYWKGPQALENFDFKSIINLPEVIHYLKNQKSQFPNGNSSRLKTAFSIAACYKHLEPQHKEDESIIRAYMENITPNKFGADSDIDEELLYQIPMKYFNHREFLTYICAGLNFDSLKRKLEKENIEPTLLSDPQFIVSNAIISPQKLDLWINTFLTKEQITKNFILDILSNNEQFYNYLHPKLSEFAKDIDIIVKAVEGGLPYEKIEIDDIRDSLIAPSKNLQFETVKVGYVISNDLIRKELEGDYRHVFANENDLNKFKKRYLKPEYLFLTRGDEFYDAKNLRKNSLSNLTLPEEISEILDYIQRNELDFSFTFQSSAFYSSMSPSLRKNKFLVEEIVKLKPFPYEELDDTLKFNTDVALAFLETDPTNIHHISPEFFNNVDFVLGFTKLMDEEIFNYKKDMLPTHIREFFKHHDVKENFHDYFEKYVRFQTLNNTIKEKEEEKTSKRIKI